jgi:hypothetical protein
MFRLSVGLRPNRHWRSSNSRSCIHSILPSLLLMLGLLLTLNLHLLRCKLSQLLVGEVRVAGTQLVLELNDRRYMSR